VRPKKDLSKAVFNRKSKLLLPNNVIGSLDPSETVTRDSNLDPRFPAQTKGQFNHSRIQTQIARGLEAQSQAVIGVISGGDPQA
jgi:hypothetical protein